MYILEANSVTDMELLGINPRILIINLVIDIEWIIYIRVVECFLYACMDLIQWGTERRTNTEATQGLPG